MFHFPTDAAHSFFRNSIPCCLFLRSFTAATTNPTTFDVHNILNDDQMIHFFLSAQLTSQQTKRDRRRFNHADLNKDKRLSRDELVLIYHPEESPRMFAVIVEVRQCSCFVLIRDGDT